jgi:hypothetical protein
MLLFTDCTLPKKRVSRVFQKPIISSHRLTGVLLRHAPDAQYVFISFAGAFLVKVRSLLCSLLST